MIYARCKSCGRRGYASSKDGRCPHCMTKTLAVAPEPEPDPIDGVEPVHLMSVVTPISGTLKDD
jgi:hypothetical protein